MCCRSGQCYRQFEMNDRRTAGVLETTRKFCVFKQTDLSFPLRSSSSPKLKKLRRSAFSRLAPTKFFPEEEHFKKPKNGLGS